MEPLLQTFSSPDAGELPVRFPSPFDEVGPHPLARRAASGLIARLRSCDPTLGFDPRALAEPGGGKMLGVLVVRGADGRLGVLQAFSGLLEGRFWVPGFAPPLFDAEERARLEVPGEALVKALHARGLAHRTSSEALALTAEQERLRALHAEKSEALRRAHANRKADRQRQRAIAASPEERHALDQQSRGDKAERRRLDEALAAERAELERRVARFERRQRAHERLRQHVSRRLMQAIHDTYRVPNARGERRSLRALFAPGEPPSGAADCAAPKLLACAQALGATPLALAEFWWGAPPVSGGRIEGAFYPACKGKCGPVLPFMIEGLDVAPARAFTVAALPERALEVVHADRWLVVVDKPEGLLSVPGKDASVGDSVLERLRALHPDARGPLLAHRLDLDTSGLLLAALDPETHRALQRQFRDRLVQKRYVAWLAGDVAGDRGTISLPLRVDLEDRPRQIHDPLHGLEAVTRYEVLAREQGRTRVALFPLTGRTHQLRVHAALGLGAPILGDRLYGHFQGQPGERLLLHAEALAFDHPHTGERLTFERKAPF